MQHNDAFNLGLQCLQKSSEKTVTIDELHREYYMHETMIHTSKTFNNSDINFYVKYVDKMLSRLRC